VLVAEGERRARAASRRRLAARAARRPARRLSSRRLTLPAVYAGTTAAAASGEEDASAVLGAGHPLELARGRPDEATAARLAISGRHHLHAWRGSRSPASSFHASAPDDDGPAMLFGRGGNRSGGSEMKPSILLPWRHLDLTDLARRQSGSGRPKQSKRSGSCASSARASILAPPQHGTIC
jgi:hypothetical protein